MIQVLIVFFITFVGFHSATAQTNFESVNKFWHIVDKLQARQNPSATEWDDLFNTSGYSLYISQNGVDSSTLQLFKSNVVKACQVDSLSNAELADNRWLSHLKRTINLKNELKKHQHWLQSIAYVDSMKAGAHTYLPNRIKNTSYHSPTVYFIVFDYDGSANVKGIFMDLLLSFDLDKNKVGAFGAHELHHYILDLYLKDKKLPGIASTHKGLFWAIQSTSTEGIANLVDKKYVLSSQSGYQDKEWYLGMLAKAPDIITQMNKNMEALMEGRNETLSSKTHWQKVLMGNGHFAGYFMAQTIEKAGISAELIEQVENPFYIFYLYNKAVRHNKLKMPVFSNQSIHFLKKLEQKYKPN